MQFFAPQYNFMSEPSEHHTRVIRDVKNWLSGKVMVLLYSIVHCTLFRVYVEGRNWPQNYKHGWAKLLFLKDKNTGTNTW